MHDILKCFFFIYLFFLIQVFKCNDYLSCSKSKCYIYCFSFWKSEHLILSYHGGHHSNCYHRAYCIQRLLSCIVCTDGFYPVIEYLLHWVTDTTIQKKWQKCNCLCLTSLTISVSFNLTVAKWTLWTVRIVKCILYLTVQNEKKTKPWKIKLYLNYIAHFTYFSNVLAETQKQK